MLHIFQKHTVKVMVLAGTLLSAATAFAPSQALAAGCVSPATDYGTVTQTVNVPATGTYRIFSRIAVPDTTNNTYLLDIDSTNCYTVGGSSSIATSAGLTQNPPTGTINWVWVDYQNGTTTSKVDVSLTAGNHTFKMIGNKPNVALDRVVITQDTTCPITGTGDNCANPADTTKPTVSISSPTNGSTVPSGTVTVNSTASDDSGTVSKLEIFIDNSTTAAKTCTSVTSCSFAWVTSALAAGSSHSVTVKATDPSNNTQSVTHTVTIQSTSTRKPGDATNDGLVNFQDALRMSSNWNKTGMTVDQGDFDGNGTVNFLDALILSNNWNK